MKALAAALIAFAAQAAHAETSIGLDDAIAFSRAHHPAVRADVAAARAAAREVDAERARYVPDIELFAQLDRGSANVVPGPLFAVPGLPVVSGSPGRDLGIGSWVSAVGATAAWDALGARTWDAAIARARAEVRLARDESSANALDRDFAAVDRFIAVLARVEAVKAARAGVDRANVFVGVVKATVGADLRAGADLSRA